MANALQIKLEETIITDEMVDEIEPEDYIYYHLPQRVKPWSKLYRFRPTEEVKVMEKGTKLWQRLIFHNDEEYFEEEEKAYQAFIDHIDQKGITFPDIVQKRNIIRFLQANDYKVKPALKELQSHLDWRDKHLPIVIGETQKELINAGYLYTHGRDKFFRPFVVHNPKVFKRLKPDINEALKACHFVMQYVVEHMLIPGYIENWIPAIDLERMSVNDIPKRRILSFINSNKMVYK